MNSKYHHPTYSTGEPVLIGQHVRLTDGQMSGTVGLVTSIEGGWLIIDSDGEQIRTDARCVERHWPAVKLDGVEIPHDLADRLFKLHAKHGNLISWKNALSEVPEVRAAAAELMSIVAPFLAAALDNNR